MKKLTMLALVLLLLCGCTSTKDNNSSSFSQNDRETIIVYLERDDYSISDGLSLAKGNTYEDNKEVSENIENSKTSIIKSVENIAKSKANPINEKDIVGDDFVIVKNRKDNAYIRLYSDGKAILINDEGRFIIEFINEDYSKEYKNIIDNLYSINDSLNSLYN